MRYDPMTGEPINDEEIEVTTNDVPVDSQVTPQSDDVPVVGVATEVDSSVEQNNQTNVEVTPASDEFVNETYMEVPSVSAPTEVFNGFDSNTQQTYESAPVTPIIDNTNKKTKSKKPFAIFGIILVVLVLVGALCFVYFSGLLSPNKTKVASAITKTFEIDSQLTSDYLAFAKLLQEKEYTVEFEFDSDDIGFVSGSYINSAKAKQIAASADTSYVTFDALVQIDSSTVKAEVPKFCDYLFTYNYTKTNKGYLIDELGKDEVEKLNSLIELLYESNIDNSQIAKDVEKLCLDYESKLDFTKRDAIECKVGGKKVKCKGIGVTLEAELIEDFYDELIDIYREYMEETFGDFAEYSAELNFDDTFDDFRDSIDGVTDVDVIFYIYDGALASVHLEVEDEDETVDIFFKGDDCRAEYITIDVDEEEVFAFKMSKKKGVEKYQAIVDDELIEIEYNTKTGEVAVLSDDYPIFEFVLMVDDESASFMIEDLDASYVTIDEISFTVSKGATLQKFKNKDTFDIGKASEDDFNDLIEEISYSLAGDFDDLY